MLTAANRLTRSSDFTAVVSTGGRAAHRDVVVHLRPSTSADAPRVGLVVGKAVGNAVVRHRVSRRLRHAARGLLAELECGDLVVVRALPGSRVASTAELHGQLRSAMSRARRAPARMSHRSSPR